MALCKTCVQEHRPETSVPTQCLSSSPTLSTSIQHNMPDARLSADECFCETDDALPLFAIQNVKPRARARAHTKTRTCIESQAWP
eukprot:11242135-Alexandrium_andersonii.AAC.1